MAGIFSYAKTLWQDGVTAITAARLNHIEQGISDAADSIKTLGDSISPLKTFFTDDKTRVTLSFESANHSTAFLIIDNNGAPSAILLNCMDSTSNILAGQSLNITFPNNKTAVIKTTNWSFGLFMTPIGAGCSVSVS